MKKQTIFILLLCLLSIFSFAQRGKDGNRVISSANTIVNEYTYLTANATSGSTTINVASSNLNTNARFTSSLAAGDLIFIIQVQGVKVKGWKENDVWQHARPMDETYGRILDYQSCGLNEYAQVRSVPNATTIELNCDLVNDYITDGDTTEVVIVRVPRYNSLTVNASASITCEEWNGQTGGIVAVEVLNDAFINGSIDVSAKGFRGGAALLESFDWNIPQYGSPSTDDGAEKGESIYGFRAEYNITKSGFYCRGAIANGGGGGNATNCGGGGGSNAGDTSLWTGYGVPSLDVPNWANAWNLELPGLATSTSSGGGKGGYSYSGENMNALTVPPGDLSWGGQNRFPYGGFGGRPLDYTTGRLFFGGGGGAGDQNDYDGGDGGNGGGLITIMVYGNISGSGTLNANGEIGGNATGSSPGWGERTGIDGAGGGGGGGAIVINAIGAITGISATANGGDGGDQYLQIGAFSADKVAEGPGGGGGGGYIAASNAITTTADGGQYGVTNSGALTEFPPNGATSGGNGIANATIDNFLLSLDDTIQVCSSDSAHLIAIINGTLPAGTSVNWYDAEIGGNLLHTGLSYSLLASSIVSGTAFYAGTCPGTYREKIIVEVIDVTASTSPNQEICPGDTCTISVVGSGSILWSNGQTTSSIDVSPSVSTIYTVSVSIGPCTAIDSVEVTLRTLPNVIANASATNLCDGDTLTLWGTGTASSYNWDSGVSDGIPFVPTGSQMYHISGTDGFCNNEDSIYITVNPLPTVIANASDTIVCIGDNLTLSGSGTATSYSWSHGVNDGISFIPAVSTTYYVTGSDASCSNIDSIFVDVVSNPVAFAGNDTSICAGDTIALIATGGAVYSWSNGTSTASNLVNPTTTTTYTVTVSQGSCTDTDDVTVTVIAVPSISAGLDQTICLGDSAILTATTSGSISWSTGESTASISVSPNTTTTYTVTASNGSCSAFDDVIVTVLPNADATITPAGPFCDNETPIILTATDTGGIWTGNGVSSIGLFDPAVATQGNHQIIYSISGQCGDADTINILVNESPILSDSIINESCIGANDGAIYLQIQGGNPPYTILWNNGNTVDSITNLIPGNYSVIVSDQENCEKSMQFIVQASNEDCYNNHIFVPNIFSPNGDGNNDVLAVYGAGIIEFEMKIYDRWGNKAFDSKSVDESWDGKYPNGEEGNVGVYTFIAKGKYKNGEVFKLNGNISLVR